MTFAETVMRTKIDTALETLVDGAVEIYGSLVERIVLFGSVARGTQTEESDIDVALLLREDPPREMNDRMLNLVVDLGLDCDKVFSVIRINYPRYVEWKDALPFYRHIDQEGVVLWQAA